MAISERQEQLFMDYVFFGYNMLPMLAFVLLDGEFTDDDRMLSERGLEYLPSFIMVIVISGVIVFVGSMASLLVRIKSLGVTPGNVFRTLIVFTITTPSAFALAYIAKENPADESRQCIMNFADHYDALYFSYSSLTTLVHGDLEPVGFCRFLTSAEAILGYLFLGALAAMFYRIMVPRGVE